MGHCYRIVNGNCKAPKLGYSSLPVELTYGTSTTVTEIEDDGSIPEFFLGGLNLVNAREVANCNDCDVIGKETFGSFLQVFVLQCTNETIN